MKQREQVGFLPMERIASNETFIFYSFNIKYVQFSLPYTPQLTCDLMLELGFLWNWMDILQAQTANVLHSHFLKNILKDWRMLKYT